MQGKGKGFKGNIGKSVELEGKVVKNEGEGIGDVILRLRCTPKAVCSLNSELEDFNSVSLVLKYKPFVTETPSSGPC